MKRNNYGRPKTRSRGGRRTWPARHATAPYNFVPLPKKVFEVGDRLAVNGVQPWEAHDRYLPGTYSGWIDLKIEALTPVYVRGPVKKDSDGWDKRESRLRHEPYSWPDGRPAIPGSSLRGLVRTLVEILSFSKIQPVTDERAFYRDAQTKNRLGQHYMRELRTLGGVQAGFIRKLGDGWAIQPTQRVRIPHDILRTQQVTVNAPGSAKWQHRECWVITDTSGSRARDIRFESPKENVGAWTKGVLLLTGYVPNKKSEAVFLSSQSDPDCWIPIPAELWERFHSDDQLTQWQKETFIGRGPGQAGEKLPGHLADGDPVYYLASRRFVHEPDNPRGLVFFGRAELFRFPYHLSPVDLIPDTLRDAGLDLAEVMFGKVATEDKEKSIKSRVFFEDAVAAIDPKNASATYYPPMVPRILSSPKIASYQHYLESDASPEDRTLKTYTAEARHKGTRIRGHKMYWHRWSKPEGLKNIKHSDGGPSHDSVRDDLLTDPAGAGARHKQHTVIKPVREGTEFRGRIRFENLTDLELGALLMAVNLPTGCHHRIGMGKPLGMGSIKVTGTLILVDRTIRYSSWNATGVTSADMSRQFRRRFAEVMFEHARMTGERLQKVPATSDPEKAFASIDRIADLYALLSWEKRPKMRETAYMDLKDFKYRSVLPKPRTVTRGPLESN